MPFASTPIPTIRIAATHPTSLASARIFAYLDYVSHYALDYVSFSGSTAIDSFNNHITNAWAAVSDGEKGLLVAQTADVNASFAFCPTRTWLTSKGIRIFLNPFGAYHGRQLKYVTAFSGRGRAAAIQMAGTLKSLAPSYNGHFYHLLI